METSKIDKEVAAGMSGFEAAADQLVANFMFGEDFIGFDGHFPTKKVLPGICQIQCVKAMLGQWKHTEVFLKEIVNAKYFLPVSPGEELTCRCRDITDNGDGYSLKASISRGSEKVSEFRVYFSKEKG